MKTYIKSLAGIILPLLSTLISFSSLAQRSDRNINEKEKTEIVAKVISILKVKYIFPEMVPLIQKTINEKLEKGQYSKFVTAEEFLKNLNADLETLSNDRHVNVFFDPVMVKQIQISEMDTSSVVPMSPAYLARAKFENFMIRDVERLDGNVGYFKFNKFLELQIAKPALVSAMELLTHSSAIIIDLRQNGGGFAQTTEFLLNYFLPDSTVIGSFTSKLDNTTKELFISRDPSVKKFPADVSVYILTSKRTSSAAEAFAYTLQAFKRATIIGDTTNGEANPGYRFALNPEMYLMVPTSINTNAITKTNWQGIGVIPDIKITSQTAFIQAQAVAYKNLASSSKDEELRSFYDWKAVGLQAEVNPTKLSEVELRIYEGSYADSRRISFENGVLYYQRLGISEKRKLIPITKDIFALEAAPYFRVRFIKNENGKTIALEGMYDDGKKEISKIIQ